MLEVIGEQKGKNDVDHVIHVNVHDPLSNVVLILMEEIKRKVHL
jgi:hypothetical protein